MNMDKASIALRDAVLGGERVDGRGKDARMVPEAGLLEMIRSLPAGQKDLALLHLGRILGVSDALAGVKFKE